MTYSEKQSGFGRGRDGDRSYVHARLDLGGVGSLKVDGADIHFDAAETVLDPPLPLVRVIFHRGGSADQKGVRLDLGKQAFLDEPLAESAPGYANAGEHYPRDEVQRAIRQISGLVAAARMPGVARRVADEAEPERRYHSGGEPE